MDQEKAIIASVSHVRRVLKLTLSLQKILAKLNFSPVLFEK